MNLSRSEILALVGILSLLGGCSGMEQSQHEKIRHMNEQKDVVYRSHDEHSYEIQAPALRTRAAYPWEEGYAGLHAPISVESFRCKGAPNHPPRPKDPGSKELIRDCGGPERHSLPLQAGKEYIYPVLIDILNYIQVKTGYPVVVTCGHRCPVHNTYADASAYNQTSKHMIGAEVDFYVQGMESRPEAVIDLVMQYYRETAPYKGNPAYEKFARLENVKMNVSTVPWFNKEILIKLYKKEEGRDWDNQHPNPYISLQIRYDKSKDEKVVYSKEKALNSYKRY